MESMGRARWEFEKKKQKTEMINDWIFLGLGVWGVFIRGGFILARALARGFARGFDSALALGLVFAFAFAASAPAPAPPPRPPAPTSALQSCAS